ncbi:hypothetical protein IG631_15970 [Alternaria alternata]|nr:hypothetical protein IG631_15970 [Alternaria alternata]
MPMTRQWDAEARAFDRRLEVSPRADTLSSTTSCKHYIQSMMHTRLPTLRTAETHYDIPPTSRSRYDSVGDVRQLHFARTAFLHGRPKRNGLNRNNSI